MVAYTTMFVDLLLLKHNHNSAAARRFLLVLGAAFDARKHTVNSVGMMAEVVATLSL